MVEVADATETETSGLGIGVAKAWGRDAGGRGVKSDGRGSGVRSVWGSWWKLGEDYLVVFVLG